MACAFLLRLLGIRNPVVGDTRVGVGKTDADGVFAPGVVNVGGRQPTRIDIELSNQGTCSERPTPPTKRPFAM